VGNQIEGEEIIQMLFAIIARKAHETLE